MTRNRVKLVHRDLKGRVIRHHEVIGVLGRGGMGEVYVARHHDLGILRALKVIRDDFKTQSSAAQRFQLEALVLARLRHPNIVSVIDYGQLDNGWPFLILEYIRGGDLGTILHQQGPMSLPESLFALIQLAHAVNYAHHQGIVHRDLKPGNVLLAQKAPRQVKIIDFGLVKLLSANIITRLTNARQVMGSPQYMAPEQARADTDITRAADIYALAGIAYALLSQKSVFGDRPPPSLIYAHWRERPERLSARVPIPRRLDDVLYACLAKDPRQRPSAEAMAKELEDILAAIGAAPVGLAPIVAPSTPATMSSVVRRRFDVPEPQTITAPEPQPEDVSSAVIDNETLTNEPLTSEPLTSEPLTSEPLTSEPLTSEPLTSEPLTSEPLTNEPHGHSNTSSWLDVPLSDSTATTIDRAANAAELICAPIPSGDDHLVRQALQRQMLAVVGELADILIQADADAELVIIKQYTAEVEDQLAALEVDAALVDDVLAEVDPPPDPQAQVAMAQQRAEMAARINRLRSGHHAAQRALAVITYSKRAAAPAAAKRLYAELDQMIERSQTLAGATQ